MQSEQLWLTFLIILKFCCSSKKSPIHKHIHIPRLQISDALQVAGEGCAIFAGQDSVSVYKIASSGSFGGWDSPVEFSVIIQDLTLNDTIARTILLSISWLLAAWPQQLYSQTIPRKWGDIFDYTNFHFISTCNVSLTGIFVYSLLVHKPVDVTEISLMLLANYPFVLAWRWLYSRTGRVRIG